MAEEGEGDHVPVQGEERQEAKSEESEGEGPPILVEASATVHAYEPDDFDL